MIKFVLGAAAFITLVLNLLLSLYLVKGGSEYTLKRKKGEVISFVLTPVPKHSTAAATELLETEVIASDGN